MAAQIPIKDDKEANAKAMAGVYADKLREVRAGHDGTWVAHPALASIANEVFNKHMPTPNQLFVRREEVHVTGNDLLNMNVPGTVTEEGIRKNLNIGLGYMEGWLKGIGCVPINYLMVSFAIVSSEYEPNPTVVPRRMLRLPKSVVLSFGSGASTAQRQLRARRSTKHMRRDCFKSKQMIFQERLRKATNTSSRRSTSPAK